jgi:DNA modification methylase
LHYNKPNSGKIPAKPQELIKILLRCFSPEGGNVLDPFAGSGTIPLTAEQMERNAFASEIQEARVMSVLDKYFELGSHFHTDVLKKDRIFRIGAKNETN